MRFNVWLAREIIRCFVKLFYRVTIIGAEHVPATGPVLFVSNHISYADPVLISASTPIPVRFLMWRPIYNWWVLTWFFRLMRSIPVAANDSPRQILRSLFEAKSALEKGERVGLFAEGEISRDGRLKEFRKGLERVVAGTHAPIIPVHIDGMWGSIFSFEGGKVFWKWPRKIPYPATVYFGSPLPPDTPAEKVREAVVSLVAL